MRLFGSVQGGLHPFLALALLAGLGLGACAGPEASMIVAVEERACYRTLGRVDCHAPPLKGEESRRVGSFDWAAARAAASD